MINKELTIKGLALGLMLGLIIGCSGGERTENSSEGSSDTAEPTTPRFGGNQLVMPPDTINANPASNANRNAYFGDLHVHTNYSFDAFAFGTVASPYDAYRFAKGEAIKHPAGFDVQLNAPLDFYAVTDLSLIHI